MYWFKNELVVTEHIAKDRYMHSYRIHRYNLKFLNLIMKYFGISRIKNQNSLQLLFTCWVLEKEFELDI